ncbi:MAG TPA: peptide deformylase [Longimicrobiales bacterium]|nr:peptide deformylase [Longimicrobiales bacterium]
MKLDVRILGDPVLREKAAPVVDITDEVRELIRNMFETMYAEEGVGLAAPQVGVSERVIVIDPQQDDLPAFALINPEILELSKETEKGEEGCLSIPGLRDVVERPQSVVVRGTTPEGELRQLDLQGLPARIIQHEVDHLDGILFFDRLSPLKRKMLLARWQKVKPE